MDRLNVAITLIPSEQVPEEVRRSIETAPDSVCRHDGNLYFSLEGEVLRCEDRPEGYELLSAIREKVRGSHAGNGYAKNIWYQFITSAESDRTAALAAKYGVEKRKKRTVILFRMKYPLEKPLSVIFTENAPTEEDDQAVILGHDSIALVKNSAFCTEDEIAEYAAAVIDTMVSEGFTDLQAGIGTEADSITELHRSYEEAQNALLTGTRFHADETLFRYSEQKLERIISQIPAENRKKILAEYDSLYGGETFGAEMMETVRVFFRHDLNITSASRQLLIHRNTLNYRLDKIKRETGLDLRTFQDAVVFRMISEMAENEQKPTD